MAQGATLEFYDSDIYPSYATAKQADGVTTVFLDYANEDTMEQTAVWDALEIINAALSAVKSQAKLRFVLTRGGQILDS